MTNLLFVPNPLLRQKAEKIRSVGPDEKKIANKMMDVMLRAPGVGLAANQIGILKQIVTIFLLKKKEREKFNIPYIILKLFHILLRLFQWRRVVYHFQNSLMKLKDQKK